MERGIGTKLQCYVLSHNVNSCLTELDVLIGISWHKHQSHQMIQTHILLWRKICDDDLTLVYCKWLSVGCLACHQYPYPKVVENTRFLYFYYLMNVTLVWKLFRFLDETYPSGRRNMWGPAEDIFQDGQRRPLEAAFRSSSNFPRSS